VGRKPVIIRPAAPGSADWLRHWTIDAGNVTLQPVTRRIAQAVHDGGPITREFEERSLHDRLPQAMSFAIRDIDSGAAAILPTVWLVVRRAYRRILGDLGTFGPPDSEGCVEIGYSLAPSARGQGIGTAVVAALVRRLAAVPGIRRLAAITAVQNTASRRLLERLGFRVTGLLPGTDEMRYTLRLSSGALPGRRPAGLVGERWRRESLQLPGWSATGLSGTPPRSWRCSSVPAPAAGRWSRSSTAAESGSAGPAPAAATATTGAGPA
jgi:RimJ/RimL family protein N-acetyltransferase